MAAYRRAVENGCPMRAATRIQARSAAGSVAVQSLMVPTEVSATTQAGDVDVTADAGQLQVVASAARVARAGSTSSGGNERDDALMGMPGHFEDGVREAHRAQGRMAQVLDAADRSEHVGFRPPGRELRAGSDVLSDLRDALAHARAHPAARSDGPANVVGFSFGGHVAVVAAARLGLRRAAVLYAGWLTGAEIALSRPQPTATLAGEIAANATRVLMLVGEDEIKRTFADAHASLKLVTYPGVSHRFCAAGHPGHDPAAEHDAWQRIAAHLA